MRRRYPLPVLAANAVRAAILLLYARIVLLRIGPRDVIDLNRRSANDESEASREATGSREQAECEKAAFFIDRVARRVPWRADCLVQALAARKWLDMRGIATRISVGAARAEEGAFEAHAWLLWRGRIVLGGDVSRFEVLLDPEAPPIKPPPR